MNSFSQMYSIFMFIYFQCAWSSYLLHPPLHLVHGLQQELVKTGDCIPLQVSFRFTQNISVNNFQDVLKAFASTDQESEIKVEPLSETQ